MAKDPAVLWYWGDWKSGTSLLSRFLKGCYMEVLDAQFNNGHLSLEEIKICLGSDFGQAWPTLQKKFKQDPDGLFFNERLEREQLKRQRYCASRSNNKSGRKKSYDKSYENHTTNHMYIHMENENRNRNRNILEKDIGGVGEKEKTFCENVDPEFSEREREKYLVPEMMSAYMRVNPNYISRKDIDFKALFQIGKTIAQAGGLNVEDQAAMQQILMIWAEVVDFISKDSFFSTYQLSQIERYFQNIFSRYRTSKEKPKPPPGKESVIEHNQRAADAAREMLAKKYQQ
ncbi:YdaU family protein [Arachidicoccus terrestris]|uniref:YdaU family protein n=1 Tax=Arachidicoccus terrestris TaxID=2875539 RepID=UPI001CC602C6|nr:YdaU family protein [Arachidicoccus terrestris]UAY56240.1 YdaU family protein [Arachidicoccus terrestris]